LGENVENGLPQFHLRDLGNGMAGLTSACGTMMAECAAVCFEDRSHSPGVSLKVRGIVAKHFSVHWQAVTEDQQRCYNDLPWATEMGAYAVAILVVKELTGKTVIERSKKGTGFDYWLGDVDEDELLFANKARLEVSGILHGSDSEIAGRMKQKTSQVKLSDDLGRMAYVAVIEFSHPVAQVEMK
jgi:hypothetical protein